MKLRFTLFMLFIFSLATARTKIVSTVDQRVEMFSIIFRLAGNPEYNTKFAKKYVSDIHSYFDKYNNHPVVDFAKKLASEKGIGFSKVMYLAVDLEFVNHKFSLIKQSENSLAGIWEMEDELKFVALANDFYKSSKFESFFNAHKPLYNEATSQFDHSVAEFDQNWYFDYYGDHNIEFKVILGLADGGANYGPSVKPIHKKKIVYAIMGSWTFNEEGKALFPESIYLSYLIHEFNHSFIDRLLDEDGNEKALKSSGEILLNNQKVAMRLEGYEDWQSVINESLVRSSVVRYMIDHKDKAAQEEISKQIKKGFLWTKELVALLGEYESSRTQHPTFKSFYPRIATFFNATASNLSK